MRFFVLPIILIVVDTGYAGIHHSKYWMPNHYDTIKDIIFHILFSNSSTATVIRGRSTLPMIRGKSTMVWSEVSKQCL